MELAITVNIATLEQLEGEMREDIHAFYRFGTNLIKIRKEQLYLLKNGGEFQTFEAYCKGVWDMTGRYARNLIASTGVIDNLTDGTIVPVKPFTESQTRPLVKLSPEKQREAWKQAVETAPEGKVTAAHVYKIVKEMTTPPAPAPQEKTFPQEPSDAIEFAGMAISQLQRILPQDPKRQEAYDKVINWIQKNRGGKR